MATNKLTQPKGKEMSKKKEIKEAKVPQPTKDEYKILIQLAQTASVPLAQSQTVLGIIQKIAQYHGIK